MIQMTGDWRTCSVSQNEPSKINNHHHYRHHPTRLNCGFAHQLAGIKETRNSRPKSFSLQQNKSTFYHQHEGNNNIPLRHLIKKIATLFLFKTKMLRLNTNFYLLGRRYYFGFGRRCCSQILRLQQAQLRPRLLCPRRLLFGLQTRRLFRKLN